MESKPPPGMPLLQPQGPLCECGHVAADHWLQQSECAVNTCGCEGYRPPREPAEPAAEKLARLKRDGWQVWDDHPGTTMQRLERLLAPHKLRVQLEEVPTNPTVPGYTEVLFRLVPLK